MNLHIIKNKFLRIIMIILIVVPLLIIGAMFSLPLPSFVIEPARPVFWSYPDMSTAKFTTFISSEGKLKIELHHSLLKGITPPMLFWWYKHLASGKATIGAQEYTYYHLFHLSEHGQMHIISPATDGSIGMGVGAVVYRQEKFGSYFSKGQARIEKFDLTGFIVTPIIGPLSLGKIEHRFLEVDGGTNYSVFTELGSDAPIIGPIIGIF